MPTYEYVCRSCSHKFEQFQSIRDEPLKKCPACGRPSLKRLVSGGAGLIFKGSGFYITDYKMKRSGEPKPGDGKPAAEGKSEKTNPAAAATAKASAGAAKS